MPDYTLIPVLPLRDVVVYPNMVIPLFVGRDKSIDALNNAIKENHQVLLVAQKEAEIDSPEISDLYEFGTLANVLQMLKLQIQLWGDCVWRMGSLEYRSSYCFGSLGIGVVKNPLAAENADKTVFFRLFLRFV